MCLLTGGKAVLGPGTRHHPSQLHPQRPAVLSLAPAKGWSMCQECSLLNFSVLLTGWIQQACLIRGTLACVPEGRTRLSPSLPSASQEVSLGATQVSGVDAALFQQGLGRPFGGHAACHTECLVKATCPGWGCRSIGLGCTQPPFPKSSEGLSRDKGLPCS